MLSTCLRPRHEICLEKTTRQGCQAYYCYCVFCKYIIVLFVGRATHLIKLAAKFAIGFDESREAEAAITATWIWQDPNRRPCKRGWLAAPGDLALLRDRGEGRFSEEGHMARRVLFDLPAEIAAAREKLIVIDLGRACGRAFYDHGEAKSEREYGVIVVRVDPRRCEPCEMEDLPEAIAPADEVVSRRCGTHAWVEAAEHDGKVCSEDVREASNHEITPRGGLRNHIRSARDGIFPLRSQAERLRRRDETHPRTCRRQTPRSDVRSDTPERKRGTLPPASTKGVSRVYFLRIRGRSAPRGCAGNGTHRHLKVVCKSTANRLRTAVPLGSW